eukprot:1139696-Pelagomonas_calceolata.AAC.2
MSGKAKGTSKANGRLQDVQVIPASFLQQGCKHTAYSNKVSKAALLSILVITAGRAYALVRQILVCGVPVNTKLGDRKSKWGSGGYCPIIGHFTAAPLYRYGPIIGHFTATPFSLCPSKDPGFQPMPDIKQ